MTDMNTAATAPTGGRRQHLGWALVLICVAQLMVVLDSTIANIALRFIQKDLQISQANLQWVVTGYALAFGGLLLLGGRLGDLYGRRRIFMIGVALFAVASGLGGLAQNEAMLMSSRGLQGLGAALASPTALALITTTFPAGTSRNRAFSVYAAMSGIGGAVGLLLGGWLTGLTPHLFGAAVDGWRLTFLINVPIGLLAAYSAPRVLQESESHPGHLDLPGALTGTFGLVAVVYGITHAGMASHGHTQWTAPETLLSLGIGVILLALFIAIERRVEHPLLPLRILANRTRATAFVTMMIVPAAMFAMFFFLSLFVQNVMGYSPLRAGVSFLPFPVAMVIGAMISAKLVARVDPRFLAGTGTILAGIALFGFHRISVDDSPRVLFAQIGQQAGDPSHHVYIGSSVSYWGHIFPFVALMAFGMALTFIPMTLSAVHRIEARDSGIGSGVLNTMQQVGGALGLATLSTISLHYIASKGSSLGHAVQALATGTGQPPAGVTQASQSVIGQAAFTHGATGAYLAGAMMIWVASLIVWIFLNVSHRELAEDGAHPSADESGLDGPLEEVVPA